MNLFSKKKSRFIIFAIFLALVGCNDSISACVAVRTNYVDDDGMYYGPNGAPFHIKTEEKDYPPNTPDLVFKQWNPMTKDEKEYLRRLLVGGLNPVDILKIAPESRFKLGLFGWRPATQKGVLAKIREFYERKDAFDQLISIDPQKVEEFFKYALRCGENKALDLGIAELYAELKNKKSFEELSMSSQAMLDFLYPKSKTPDRRESAYEPLFRGIFNNFLKHLDHCSEESRKAGNPRNYTTLIGGINLFFGLGNSIAKCVSPLSLQSLGDPDTRPVFESLCRHDHSPLFKKTFATETWSSRLTNGRNLGPITVGLGILASTGFGLLRWLETKSIEYQKLSRKAKKEKTSKFNRRIIGILAGSGLVGLVLFKFLSDRYAVKFLDLKYPT